MSSVTEPSVPASEAPASVWRLRVGLSGKLLMLTVLFVLLAEILIYVPLIANFRVSWLNDRLAAAHTAALVLDAAPSGAVPESLTKQILDSIGSHGVAVKMGDQRRLLAAAELPSSGAHVHDIDMRNLTWAQSIKDSFVVLFMCKPGDVLRVIGPAPMAKGLFIEIILDEGPLRAAMLSFSVTILLVSLVISIFTAALVFLALHYLLVRPMGRLTANIVAFRADPENPGRVIENSGRADEIGTAEEALGGMQRELASLLHQKSHLASLGLAVAKINHDLRNLLSSAQLFSDQLTSLPDPKVQRFAPKLMQSLQRAIDLCQTTLSYGRAQEAAPERKAIAVEPLLEDVRESLGLTIEVPIRWIVSVERDLTVDADSDQMFRILVNLARNSVQALEAHGARDPARDQIRITGRREGAIVAIEVSDTGPGISDKARQNLYQAFRGSTRPGGSGLGLAIAAELVKAHGGDIILVEGTMGATFRITIPDGPVALSSRRKVRA